MLEVIVAKALWAVGGAVAGWLLKKWHVKPLLDAVNETLAKARDEVTPADRK